MNTETSDLDEDDYCESERPVQRIAENPSKQSSFSNDLRNIRFKHSIDVDSVRTGFIVVTRKDNYMNLRALGEELILTLEEMEDAFLGKCVLAFFRAITEIGENTQIKNARAIFDLVSSLSSAQLKYLKECQGLLNFETLCICTDEGYVRDLMWKLKGIVEKHVMQCEEILGKQSAQINFAENNTPAQTVVKESAAKIRETMRDSDSPRQAQRPTSWTNERTRSPLAKYSAITPTRSNEEDIGETLDLTKKYSQAISESRGDENIQMHVMPEKVIAQIRELIAKTNEEIAGLESRKDSFIKQIIALQSDIDARHVEIEQMDQECEVKRQSIDKMQKDKSEKLQERQIALKNIRELEEKIASLDSQLETERMKGERIGMECLLKGKELQSSIIFTGRLKKEYDDLNNKILEIQAVMSVPLREKNITTSKIAEINKNIKNIECQIAELDKQIDEINKRIQSLKNEIQSVKEHIRTNEAAIVKFQLSIQELGENIEEKNSSKKDYEGNLRRLLDRISRG